jgi:hypothetical protein
MAGERGTLSFEIGVDSIAGELHRQGDLPSYLPVSTTLWVKGFSCDLICCVNILATRPWEGDPSSMDPRRCMHLVFYESAHVSSDLFLQISL